jgi:addiction module RelB/DinJ family antitoxin
MEKGVDRISKIIADKAITVRVDGATKEQAEQMLAEMGITMTAYLTSSLKALVRERRIPFAMVTEEYLRNHMILAKLYEIDNEMNATDARWLTQDEVFGTIREQFGCGV